MAYQRKDAFEPGSIEEVLRRYAIRTIVSCHDTWNLHFIKNITENFYYLSGDQYWFLDKGKPDFKKLAYVCQNRKLDEQTFIRTQSEINNVFETNRRPNYRWRDNLKDYNLIYSKEVNSNIEIEFSSRTKNAPNSFFYYILEKIKDP